MKNTIRVSVGGYGFSHNWTLICKTPKKTKSFFLGQDVKFCKRVLGLDPKDIRNCIGSNDLTNEKTLKKLANFIVKELCLNGHNIGRKLDWEFSAE